METIAAVPVAMAVVKKRGERKDGAGKSSAHGQWESLSTGSMVFIFDPLIVFFLSAPHYHSCYGACFPDIIAVTEYLAHGGPHHPTDKGKEMRRMHHRRRWRWRKDRRVATQQQL